MSKKIEENQSQSIKDKKQYKPMGYSHRTSPIANATSTMVNIFRKEPTDAEAVFTKLLKQQDDVIKNGDTTYLEAMLLNQAQVLQSLFHYASERISHSEMIPQFQAHCDLAIKANNACRKTVLAIAQLKNPSSTTFVKQQNNAINQQINNAVEFQNLENSENRANELLIEEKQDAPLDIRGTFTSSQNNSEMETVEIGRGKNSKG